MSKNSLSEVFSSNPINQCPLFGTTPDEPCIIAGELATNLVNRFIALKCLCRITMSQQLHKTVCDHYWKFILKGRICLASFLWGDYYVLWKAVLWHATDMYKIKFCSCYSSTSRCSDFCYFSWLLIFFQRPIEGLYSFRK